MVSMEEAYIAEKHSMTIVLYIFLKSFETDFAEKHVVKDQFETLLYLFSTLIYIVI